MTSSPTPAVTAAARSANAALTAWNAPDTDLVLVRHSANTLFAAPRLRLAIRVASPGIDPRLGATLATRAVNLGLPAVAPVPDLPALHTHGRWVTAYPLHPQPLRPPATDWAWLGAAVRAVHDATAVLTTDLPPHVDLPDLTATPHRWVTDKMVARTPVIATNPAIPAADKDLLLALAQEPLPPLDGHPAVLIHGDTHPGNILTTTTGPALIDWDGALTGPWWFDHLPTACQASRFTGTTQANLDAFAHTYGRHPYDLPGFDTWVRLKLLSGTFWIASLLADRPEMRPEYEARMAYWRNGPNPPPWQVL